MIKLKDIVNEILDEVQVYQKVYEVIISTKDLHIPGLLRVGDELVMHIDTIFHTVPAANKRDKIIVVDPSNYYLDEVSINGKIVDKDHLHPKQKEMLDSFIKLYFKKNRNEIEEEIFKWLENGMRYD